MHTVITQSNRNAQTVIVKKKVVFDVLVVIKGPYDFEFIHAFKISICVKL